MENLISKINENIVEMRGLVKEYASLLNDFRINKRITNLKGEIVLKNAQEYQVINMYYNQYVGSLNALEYCADVLSSKDGKNVAETISLKKKYWERKQRLSTMMINTYKGERGHKYRILDHVSSRGNLECGIFCALEHVENMLKEVA